MKPINYFNLVQLLLLPPMLHGMMMVRRLHKIVPPSATTSASPLPATTTTTASPPKRWRAVEAKQMLRELEMLRKKHNEGGQEDNANKIREKDSLWQKFVETLFGAGDAANDDGGPTHDCFFSAFNCPVNPSRNIVGVRRVRITAQEREHLLANANKNRRKQRSDKL